MPRGRVEGVPTPLALALALVEAEVALPELVGVALDNLLVLWRVGQGTQFQACKLPTIFWINGFVKGK